MHESLQRLSKVPDDVILFPGHRYSVASSALMASVKETNFVFQATRPTDSTRRGRGHHESMVRPGTITAARS